MQRVIGFDAKRAFLNASGLGNYSRNTLNALGRHFPQNAYVLFTPVGKPVFFHDDAPFKIVTPPNHFFKILKPLWRSFFLSKYLQKYDLELFHGLSNELPRGIHKTGIRSVVTIHDLIFMRYPEFYTPIDRTIYFSKMRYACHAADRIIAISRQTKNDVEAFFQVPSEKIDVIYQPVAQAFFEQRDCSGFFSGHSIPSEYILAVGTLEPRKNQLGLLHALAKAGIELPVVFVGKQTGYMGKMRKFAEESGLPNPLIFLSGISDDELAGLFRNALVSVYISLFEGFGLPVIESMASGCPVITSSVSCLPETAGNAALLCDPGNIEEIGEKINTVLNDTMLRKEITQKGRERAKLFQPLDYAQKLISLYSKITSG